MPSTVLLRRGRDSPAGHLQVHRHQSRQGTAEPARAPTSGGRAPPIPAGCRMSRRTHETGRCDSPATYVGGDANGNDLLDPGEEWQFTCPGTVTATTVNIARSSASPRTPTVARSPGSTRSRTWRPPSSTSPPGIAIIKTALRDPVLDPDAPAVSRPRRARPPSGGVHLRGHQHRHRAAALTPTRRSTTPAARWCLRLRSGRHQRRRAPRSRRGVALHLHDHPGRQQGNTPARHRRRVRTWSEHGHREGRAVLRRRPGCRTRR